MRYCTLNDIIDDIGNRAVLELTDDRDPPVAINETLVNKKIDEASTYIDSYIFERYPMPITDTDDLALLKKICVALVVTELYFRRLGLDYSDSIQARRKEAMDNLDKIQKGIIKLKSGNTNSKPLFYRVSQTIRSFGDELRDF